MVVRKDDPADDSTEPTSGDAPEANGGEYGAAQMKHLSDLEHVRERPGMYIGDSNVGGLHLV